MARADAHTQRGFVLEARTGCGLDQACNVVGHENARQLPRIIDARELLREIGAPERDGNEKTQRHGRGVHARWLHAAFDLMHLIAAQIFSRRRLQRTTEELGKVGDVADIVGLRLLAEPAHRHVFDHAAAQWADGLDVSWGHWGGPEVGVT